MSDEARSRELHERATARNVLVVIPWFDAAIERLREDGIEIHERGVTALRNVVSYAFAEGANFGRVELAADLNEALGEHNIRIEGPPIHKGEPPEIDW